MNLVTLPQRPGVDPAAALACHEPSAIPAASVAPPRAHAPPFEVSASRGGAPPRRWCSPRRIRAAYPDDMGAAARLAARPCAGRRTPWSTLIGGAPRTAWRRSPPGRPRLYRRQPRRLGAGPGMFEDALPDFARAPHAHGWRRGWARSPGWSARARRSIGRKLTFAEAKTASSAHRPYHGALDGLSPGGHAGFGRRS